MTEMDFYSHGLPGVKQKKLPGKLIVLEGTDGVGRSTQVALLKEWLESEGYAVSATGLKRGKLTGRGIQQAKEGHTMGDTTMNLLYATDLVDRLERDIIPSLRAGFVVLTDRYIYSIIARALVRGADPVWIHNVFGFALVPDIIFYLQADLAHLVPRVLNARGFGYWESGADFLQGRDYYDSFVEYQTRLLAQFDAIADEFHFVRIDANRSIREVFQSLQAEIKELLKGMKPPKQPKGAKKEAEGKPKEKEEKGKKKGEEKPKGKEREEKEEEKKEAKKEKETAKTKETKK
jgi:dTMP kinase